MLIHGTDDELKMILDVSITLAPNHAMLKLALAPQSVDRNAAAEVIRDRVMRAFGRYQNMRGPFPHEEALGTLPLIPEDKFHQLAKPRKLKICNYQKRCELLLGRPDLHL